MAAGSPSGNQIHCAEPNRLFGLAFPLSAPTHLADQSSGLFHVDGADSQRLIAGQYPSGFINSDHPVSIPVKGKPGMGLVFHNRFPQGFRTG